MGYNKITNLLDKPAEDQIPKFATIKWIEIFYRSNGTYNKNKDINQLRNDLCDFNDAYFVVTGQITATDAELPNNKLHQQTFFMVETFLFKNSVPFFNCT